MNMILLIRDIIAVVRATGYLARNWYLFNRNVWLGDIVEYTSAGFLGLTLKCARCHSHKYDPISQREYYQLYAFFNSTDDRDIQAPRPSELASLRPALSELDRVKRRYVELPSLGFSASMLVHGTLALSDGPAMMFLGLALFAISSPHDAEHDRNAIAIGIWTSAAIGTRPQLFVPIAPMLIIALLQMRTMRQRAAPSRLTASASSRSSAATAIGS